MHPAHISLSPMTSIALLLCGRITGKPLAENGDYYEIYLRYMQQSCPSNVPFNFHKYDVRDKMEYPLHEDDYSCMVLTGSGTFYLTCTLSSVHIHNSLISL